MSGGPIRVLNSYLTDVYPNGSAPSFLVGRISETENVSLSLGAFLRAAQYGLVSCFVHYRMMSAFAGHGALLQVPRMFVDWWFRYGIFNILKDVDVDPALALLATARVVKVDWNAWLDSDWFS